MLTGIVVHRVPEDPNSPAPGPENVLTRSETLIQTFRRPSGPYQEPSWTLWESI